VGEPGQWPHRGPSGGTDQRREPPDTLPRRLLSRIRVVFAALVVEKDGNGTSVELRRLIDDDLMEGDVTVDVAYSSVNYKDGLATLPDAGVARISPLIPGIDFAGTVASSGDPRFPPGTEVIGGGAAVGVSHHGGFAQRARVPGDYLVRMPAGLDTRSAMAAGTAGMTAAMAVCRLDTLGARPDQGPLLVTGASGGVGSWAVALAARKGYEVHASTGKPDRRRHLLDLGATSVIDRLQSSERTLVSRRWASVIDAVGGSTLAAALTAIDRGGVAVATGNTGGMALMTSVAPFILRGATLTGIDSAAAGPKQRTIAWNHVAAAPRLDDIIEEITLDRVPAALRRILAGEVAGRLVVTVGDGNTR